MRSLIAHKAITRAGTRPTRVSDECYVNCTPDAGTQSYVQLIPGTV